MNELTLYLTARCNLDCAFCPRHAAQAEPAELAQLVARAARRRPRRLYLSGGEPLLLRRLPALVALAREEGAAEVVVDSNGLLLADAERVRALREAGASAVRLFLPSGDPERYAALTGLPGGLERVALALSNLRAAGLTVIPHIPRHGPSPEDRASAQAFLAARGIHEPSGERGGAPAAEVFVTENLDEQGGLDSVRVAITYRCDQRCTLCDLANVDGQPPEGAVARAIDQAAARGARALVLTGGEPLLHPDLDDFVRQAKRGGLAFVEIQTNAVGLAAPGRAEALARAGADALFVSFHGADPARSDAMTRAAGSHARTVEGIERALAAGLGVDLNCVLTTVNLAELPALVEFVAERWQAHPAFGRLHIHTVRVDPKAPEPWRGLVPPYSAVGPVLRQALLLARERGLPVTGPASAMGVPYCVLDGDPELLGPLAGPGRSRPYQHERAMFSYVAACVGCRLRGTCPGVRRGYLALHGEEGLRGLPRD